MLKNNHDPFLEVRTNNSVFISFLKKRGPQSLKSKCWLGEVLALPSKLCNVTRSLKTLTRLKLEGAMPKVVPSGLKSIIHWSSGKSTYTPQPNFLHISALLARQIFEHFKNFLLSRTIDLRRNLEPASCSRALFTPV